MMSLDDYINSGPSRFQSPSSANEWMPKDFPDDNFFLDGSFDPPLNLTGKTGFLLQICWGFPPEFLSPASHPRIWWDVYEEAFSCSVFVNGQ